MQVLGTQTTPRPCRTAVTLPNILVVMVSVFYLSGLNWGTLNAFDKSVVANTIVVAFVGLSVRFSGR